jgi:hypothetical protein
MNQFIRIMIVFFLFVGAGFGDDLEIKVNQKSIKLPYWPAKEPHYGGILIVRGGAVQWSEFLAGFAAQLADKGWSTALLNCNTDSDIPWSTQLPEAISVLRQNKNTRIILIHYGEQLNLTLDYFSKPQAKMINGLILLSAYDVQKSLEKPAVIRFPVLDIVGQFDYDTALSQIKTREKQLQPTTYLSIEIPGAASDYEYSQQLLLSFMQGWMLKLSESITQANPISPPRSHLKSYIEPIFSLKSSLVAINEVGYFIQKDGRED